MRPDRLSDRRFEWMLYVIFVFTTCRGGFSPAGSAGPVRRTRHVIDDRPLSRCIVFENTL